MGQPTRYAFKLIYCVGDESIVKTLITSGAFSEAGSVPVKYAVKAEAYF